MPEETRSALGIDVGGTKIAAAVVGADGRIAARARRDTPGQDLDLFVSAVAACGREAEASARRAGLDAPAAVGVGIPAQVEMDGTIPHCTNLPMLVGSDVVARLAKELKVAASPRETGADEGAAGKGTRPVAIENDANVAALGEALRGAAPTGSLVLITLGTGAGGGVVVDGRLLRGPHGSAGELGHMVVLVDGPLCPCGQRGCLEALVAAPYVAARARAAMLAARDASGRGARAGGQASAAEASSSLWDVPGAPESVGTEELTSAARAGDPLARRVMDETARYLGAGFSSVANLFAPERIALGGGFGEASADLLVPVAVSVMKRDALAGSVRGISVGAASLGQDAGVIGAAMFGLAEAGLLPDAGARA